MPTPAPAPKSGLSNLVAEWLWVRLGEWVERGILTPEQKTRIQELYLWPPHVTAPAAPSRPANLILVLEIIGAVLVGIGLITFIAFHWPHLAPGLKLGLIVALILAVHLAGYALHAFTRFRGAGEALSVLGNLAYGAGIWLVAQIYHLPPSFPQGMLIWAVGILPMAWVFRSRFNFFLAIACFLAWTLGLSLGDQTPQPLFLVVLLGLLAPTAYFLGSRAGLAICLAVGGLWLLLNTYLWADLKISAFLVLPMALYGLLLLAVSNLHAGRERFLPYRPVYRVAGSLILGAAILAQPGYALWAISRTPASLGSLPWTFWLSAGLLTAAAAAAAVAPAGREPDPGVREVRRLFPALAAASWFWLVLPLIRFSVLPSWLGPAAALGALAWTRQSRTPVRIGVVLLLFWLGGLILPWEKPVWVLELFMVAGAALYAQGWLDRRLGRSDAGLAFNAGGLVVALAPLFFMTFHAFNREFFSKRLPLPANPDFWILWGGFAAAWAAGAWRIAGYAHPRHPRGLLPEERILALLLGLAPAGLGAVVVLRPLSDGFTFALNAALLLVSVTLLIAGYRRREIHLKVLGFVWLSLVVGCRFFEMDWSLLYKSLLLVAIGVLIMAVGILFEKNKDKVAVID